MTPNEEVVRLKKELVGLFGHMYKIRKELAVIGDPDGEKDHFSTMSDLLDGIVEEADSASNKIMENMEASEILLEKVRAHVTDKEILSLLDQITEHDNSVFEACAFQDLTGQRVSKIAKSLKFIEDRIKRLIYMWGRDELAAIVAEYKLNELGDEDPDKKLLNGPQRIGVAITQDEIDKLFG